MEAAQEMPAVLLASRYNFAFEQGGRVVLFNARTGTSWVLEGEAALALGTELSSAVQAWSSDGWEPAVLQRLLDGGFLVDPAFDEVAEVRRRYWAARHEAPMVVTVARTRTPMAMLMPLAPVPARKRPAMNIATKPITAPMMPRSTMAPTMGQR